MRALPLSIALSLVACGGDDGPSEDDGSGDEDRDASTRPDGRRPDAGTPKDDGGKGNDSKVPSNGDPKLEALAGRYLMRWDVLGTATSEDPLGGPLSIRSRLSTLVLAELSVEGDQLVSKERVCTQVAEQKCKEGCTKASTVVDQRVINNFLASKNQSREWTLDGDTLKAGKSVAQLGYDDGDLDSAAPTSNTDQRVWNVDTSTPAREGFLTRVSVTLKSVPIPVTCSAFGTQKYVSAFTAEVGSDGSFTYPAKNLDLEGSEAPVLGSDNTTCDMQAEMARTPIDNSTARLVRYGDDLGEAFWTCPDQDVFDEKLPPTEPNLDGP